MNIINFAIDFGNGYVKAKSEKGEFIVPAKIGFENKVGKDSLDKEFENKYDLNVFSRKEDKQKYVFGKDIEKVLLPKNILNTDATENRYIKTSFQQLVDFSLVELAKFERSNSLDIRLVTGMPSIDLQNKKYVSDFKEYLKGNHVIKRNDEEFVINIKELKIIEQPLGTLLNVFLNDELQVHKTLKEGLIVVIDFGSGTTIVDIYNNMKRIGGETQQDGMIQFYKDISENLMINHAVNVKPQFIEVGIINDSYDAIFGTQVINFKNEFDMVLDQKIQQIMQVYESEIGQESIVNDFIVTGGGSFIIGDAIKSLKPSFRVVDNPQFSTTNGYYKLAQSIGKAD